MGRMIITISEEDKKALFEASHIARMPMAAFVRSVTVRKALEVIEKGEFK